MAAASASKLGPAGCACAAVSRKAHDKISQQQLLHQYFAANAETNPCSNWTNAVLPINNTLKL